MIRYESSETSTLNSPTSVGTGVWSKEEHAKFLEAIKIYSSGPWKFVAAYVGTRNVRQTMTHAQKYRQKAARRLRGLRTKQALMRMHFGHHVSEEFLMQERMRSIGAAQSNNCMLSKLINYPILATPTEQLAPQSNCHTAETGRLETRAQLVCNDKTFGSEMEATPWVFPQLAEDPVSLDTIMHGIEDIDLVEDLTTSPTLEECATELLTLLF
ncbi:hypothetical protein BBO99_00005723 [Phytophthora kernoviae]|uniref:Uncharacterized protein n=2 Tax=Phytophthora kernoviae TaxID=325452 RepID=A0A3R7G7H3_9STRA|nr:hypothetical protein G195_006232 [Phytophthora kernoviae 00238/432]KAG2520123.1 hypothetical protein JM16_006871 [Phytophthora kernoviae]KAG2525243.1 hypothetical protein JM18_004982 [Phytophthora kernoviae]RLN36989.1 hypothetical protein BBI17_005756 [Phytophthora kernoviae]RLN78785.1 hypothetical protein BBO99_00005723 [Phytophthora kernoviae]